MENTSTTSKNANKLHFAGNSVRIDELRFGVDVERGASLPQPGTDARRAIYNEQQLQSYQAAYGRHLIHLGATRWGLQWVVPAFEASRAIAIQRKANTLREWNTTE